MNEEIVQLHAIIHGHVQGVFFRATTHDYAQQLGLTGTVKNVPGGTVEIYAQGKQEDLDRLLDKLQGPTGPGRVESIIKNYSKPEQLFDDFRVVY